MSQRTSPHCRYRPPAPPSRMGRMRRARTMSGFSHRRLRDCGDGVGWRTAESVVLAASAAGLDGGRGHQAALSVAGMKSSGRTPPSVASRIRTSLSPGGNTSPLHQRETALWVAPTFLPKAAIVRFLEVSQSRSFMTPHCASHAHARQAHCSRAVRRQVWTDVGAQIGFANAQISTRLA